MFDSRIEVIEKVTWDGEQNVEIRSGGGVWAGSKRKDFWNPDDDWESKIIPGVRIRLWTISWSIVIGFEIELNGDWIGVWCKANDFELKAERDASSKAYADFILAEGKRIAEMIDEGKSLEQIDNLIDDGHSGNTFAWALNYGVGHAKDKEKGEVIRKAHNAKYTVTGEGLVNPAVLTIEV